MAKSRRGRVSDRGGIPTPPQRIARDRPLFYGGPDPITLNKMSAIVTNLRTLQEERFSRSSQADPRRDLDDECGYPKHEWTAEEYHDLIMYEPAAAIVNAIYPIEAWQVSPSLFEQEDAESKTQFEEEWDALPTMLGAEPSYHAEESGSKIWSTCLTADILAGECRYGIILIGLKDGKELSEPASYRKGQEITFLRPFPEYLARVNAFEYDKSNPRYGQPLSYSVQFSDPRDSGDSGLNEPNTTEYVHWSRVVHIADMWHTASPSAIFAVPRIKPVRNPILDVRKVRASSAEMYYKGAFGGHHFGTHPQLGADVDVDADAMRDVYEEYINGLQRAIFTSGMSVDPLAPQVVDPTPQILAHIEAIAMKIRCPKRKLIGNETGERATEDDAKQWAGILGSRNDRQTTPNLIAPLVNRLINLGVLSIPKKGYRIWWPELYAMSEETKATTLLTRTQAYVAYSSGMETIVPPLDYMTKFDDMEEEEAEAILASAAEALEDPEQPAPLLSLVGGVDAILSMFEKFQMKAISEETLKQLIMLFYKVPEDRVDDIIADGLPEQPEMGLPAIPGMKPKGIGGGFPKPIMNVDKEETLNCGGPGSGIPGPCPSGVEVDKANGLTSSAVAATKAALEKTKGANAKILYQWMNSAEYHNEKGAHKYSIEIHESLARFHSQLSKKVNDLHALAAKAHKAAEEAHASVILSTKRAPTTDERPTHTIPEDFYTNKEELIWDPVLNKFCATGKGGGIDPTCTAGGGKSKRKAAAIAKTEPDTRKQPDSQHLHTKEDGSWTEPRKKLHKELVDHVFKGKTPVEKPISYIMGGGPAAGKSTILPALNIPKNSVEVAPDEIKIKLPDYKQMAKDKNPNAGNFVHRESGHVTDLIQERGSKGGYNTTVDGTADGSIDSLAPYLQKMKDAGQKVVANYVTVDTQVAVDRAFKRGQETGRFVPEGAIRAIHKNVSKVVPEAIKRGLYDEFTLWDTGVGGKPLKVASAVGKKLKIHNKEAWQRFLDKGKD